MDQETNLRAKTIKFLVEKINGNFHDIGFGNGLLNMTSKHWKKKRFDLIKIKNFVHKGHYHES